MYYRFTKVVEEGPNGSVLSIILPEVDGHRIGNELATINGVTYISLPEGLSLPTQHTEIALTQLTMTDELKAEIRASSPADALIRQQIRSKIREKYDAEDEMYFARISVGALMGQYTYRAGEAEEVLAYGTFIESVRQWAQDEREKLGL